MISETTTRHRRRSRRAFTLMEMIVVVTIIALLAGLIVPRLWSRVGAAKVSVAKSAVSNIATQVHAYVLDTGTRIDDDFDLRVLLAPPNDGGGPNGPYLQKKDDLVDPWENELIIRVPGEVNYDFDVVSAGEDGAFGTPDDITQ